MQLHSLTLQAVGPFAGSHTIDFGALAASGLFLLEGPTGAGKSTLIDAVVFALYGKVASADASDDRLRSAYADDDTQSVVDLVFEVASGRYRVRRTPAYDRSKRRGSGTTRQQASVCLWRLTGDDSVGGETVGEVLSTRLDEVGVEIQRIVGLDRTQFVQTIVLPQGEFAKFLRAEPERRRDLLQKVFGTEVYEKLQQRLVEMRKEADRAVGAARDALTGQVAHLVGAAHLAEDDATALRAELGEAATAVDAGALRERTRALASATSRAAAEAAEVAVTADTLRAQARSVLDDATVTAGLLAQREALRTEQAALLRAADEHEAAAARLATARRALAVWPLVRAVEAAGTELDAVRKSLRAAVDAAPATLLRAIEVAAEEGGEPAADRGWLDDDAALPLAYRCAVGERESALTEGAALEQLVALEAELESRRHELRAVRAQVDDLGQAVAADDAWLAARPDERSGLQALLAEVRAAAELLPGALHLARELEATATALVALDRTEQELQRATAATATAARVAAQAAETESRLREARIAGLAGELADALQDGSECPVCGAVEHPRKAELADGHVSAEAVAEAERVRGVAMAALEGARAELARLEERVAAARVVVGDATPQDVAERLVAARAALATAQDAVEQVATCTSALEEHDAATRDRQKERAATVARLAGEVGRAEVLAQALADAEAQVEQARAGHPTVAARRSAIAERADAAGALVDAIDARLDAGTQADHREAELADAMSAHDFADIAAVRAAHLGAAEITALDAQVTAATAAGERVRLGLARPEIAALPEDLAVDLEGARAAEALARAAAAEAAAAATLADRRAEAVHRAVEAVDVAAAALAAQVEAAAPVTRMAGLAAGTGSDNGKGLSLATYVLARRFEDVVAAANERLVGMSDGRYELTRSDRKEDVGSRRTGLSMRVIDHRTDQERDPRTLSGGETFYVSLCLALGLADVVTAEAGGIELGTLFVDEGFGSLDPHTLDQVLVELGRLRAGGRVVGVVSHVETLKQAIADRIEVRPTDAGPSTLTVRAS